MRRTIYRNFVWALGFNLLGQRRVSVSAGCWGGGFRVYLGLGFRVLGRVGFECHSERSVGI